jgi:anti-anti-sigma factor
MEASMTGLEGWVTAGGDCPSLEIRQHNDDDGALRLSLIGEVDIAVTETLTFRLGELERVRRLVRLDLTGLRFIDVAGVGVLVRAVTHARAIGCNLEIGRVLTPAVETVVALTGVAPQLWPDRRATGPSSMTIPPTSCAGRRRLSSLEAVIA